MLRRVFQFRTGCLLLEGSVSRYMQFPNVKETYTSDGKYQVRAIYSGIL
jgi:hypothetical protein